MLNFIRRLWRIRNDSGQVAVIFALSIIPVLTIISMTVDFQRTTALKSEILHELDAAVLRGARHIQTGKKPAEVVTILQAEMKKRVDSYGDIYCDPLQIKFGNRNRELNGTIACSVETMIGPPAGPDNISFKVAATSAWDVGLLDVAFMFDISGSMQTSNRIKSLKEAAHDALDILIPEGNESLNDGVRIAMVAYDDMVNAGDTFEDVTGLAKRRTYHATDRYRDQRTVRTERYKKRVCKWTGRTCTRRNEKGNCTKWSGGKRTCKDEWRTRNIKEFYGPQKTRNIRYTIDSTCVWERPGDEAFTDAAPKNSAGGQPSVVSPKSNIYNATEKIYNASEVDGNPHGYMAAAYAYLQNDRADNKDWFKRSGENCSGIEPLGLTKDRGKLEDFIDGLKTRGGTAGHQGIAWSWYMVSEKWGGIFSGDSKPNSFDEAQGSKALILMSDGEFIDEEFRSELGTSDQQARALCDAIKAQDEIQIFTVAFQAPVKGEEVLEYCASSPANAFSADDAQQLKDAYNSIAGSLSELRITQ